MLATFVALPASLTFLCLPTALANVVSFGEMSSLAGTTLVAAAVGGLGPGIFGEAVLIVATSAAYSCRDAVSPFRAILCRALIAFAGMAGAIIIFRGVALIWAIGLSFSAATLISATYLHWRQIRLRRSPTAGMQCRYLGEFAVSSIAVVPGWLVLYMFDSPAAGDLMDALVGFSAVVVSGLTYLTVQWLRESREFAALFTVIYRSKSASPQYPVEWKGK